MSTWWWKRSRREGDCWCRPGEELVREGRPGERARGERTGPGLEGLALGKSKDGFPLPPERWSQMQPQQLMWLWENECSVPTLSSWMYQARSPVKRRLWGWGVRDISFNFYFDIILDLQKSWKYSTEFPYALYPVSSSVTILCAQKNLTLVWHYYQCYRLCSEFPSFSTNDLLLFQVLI